MSEQSFKHVTENGLRDQEVALIHTALHEFVTTHRPGDTGLYPLINQIVLLIQKPVIIVVFRKPVNEARNDPSGWAINLPYPEKIHRALVREIGKRLERSAEDRAKWIVEIEGVNDPTIEPHQNFSGRMYGIGVLYSQLTFENDNADFREGDELALPKSAKRLTRHLDRPDMDRLRALFESIRNHRSSKQPAYHSHFHHIAHYWVNARELKNTVFQRDHEIKGRADGIGPRDLTQLLKPVFREIDHLYMSLRGGTAGVFQDFDSRLDAGAPLIFSRYRKAQMNGRGVRPPTIYFYLQLRVPTKNRTDQENGYRIVPLVTRSMCLDEAATIVDYRNRKDGQENARIAKYLEQMGADPQGCDFSDVDALAETIREAMRVEKFLGDKAYHSMTYPAFSGGLSTIFKARACSRADRLTLGPEDFLLDTEDTAFVKPILVSGSAFAAAVTKSNAPAKWKSESSRFDSCYYNYSFHQSVIRRWVSRLIRRAAFTAYVEEIARAIETTLTTEGCGAEISDGPGNIPKVHIGGAWFAIVNEWLDALAQAFPFAKVQLTPHFGVAKDNSIDPSTFDDNLQRIQELTDGRSSRRADFYYYLERNHYYGRKLVDDDERFIRKTTVQEAINSALRRAQRVWAKDAPPRISQ